MDDLASAPHGDDPLADSETGHERTNKVARQLKESGISHVVSKTTELAIGIYPLGTAAGVGTRLVRSRIQTGREAGDALHRLGRVLRSLHAQADGELRRTI